MRWSLLLLACIAACAGTKAGPTAPVPKTAATPATPPKTQPDASRAEPAVEPPVAFLLGLMPLKSTGVDVFRTAHPTYDGRGVLIAILDSGIDPGVAGLIATSPGSPKILDLRDFSGEGRIGLTPIVRDAGDRVRVNGALLTGAARIARLTAATTWYAGVFRELPLGPLPAGDVNGNGENTDAFPVVVVKATDGWVVFLDTNLDGSFEDEMPLHDYRQGRQTIALGTRPITLVANFADPPAGAPADTPPWLDLFFDTSAHGTHVAGIAAGHNLFNVAGFDGVAPGAQVIGLKIANNARGGVTVHASMWRAMDYAARFAAQRNLPLVLNLSFGVGNEHEGRAVMDSLVNTFLASHPDVVLAISAGNDGPGLSTMGFPGSADLALSVGASYPGVFTRAPQPGVPTPRDVLGWFSSRGGELAKPDVVTPGVAFSVVPPWATGDEIKGGTSMAAPHAAGLVACLMSAMAQEGRRVSSAELVQALRVSARPFAGATIVDQGTGTPVLEAAYQWLKAGHQGSVYAVHVGTGGASAAYHRDGLGGDSGATFTVRHLAGLRAAQFRLHADAPWLTVPDSVDVAPRATDITVGYNRSALSAPGVYIGTVTAKNPSDTLAGPLFTLVNTVIVPHELDQRPLYDERRGLGPAAVRRYFLRAPQPGSTLRASVTLPDSQSQRATVRLYEPNGAPARSAPEDVEVGGEDPGTAVVTVRGEDLVPGVYELDIVAPPLNAVTTTVRAELGAVALNRSGSGVEASSVHDGTVSGRVTHVLVGAERTYTVSGRGLPAETLSVRAPAWANRAEVDVQLSPDLWDEFTDFSVTVYDSTGQQIPGANEAVNYAFGRLSFAVPEKLAGRPLTVELYPAFARLPGHPWSGSVRIRFLGKDKPLGDGSDLSVVAGGRAAVAVPVPGASAIDLPPGFAPLVETRVTTGTAGGATAARRSAVER